MNGSFCQKRTDITELLKLVKGLPWPGR